MQLGKLRSYGYNVHLMMTVDTETGRVEFLKSVSAPPSYRHHPKQLSYSSYPSLKKTRGLILRILNSRQQAKWILETSEKQGDQITIHSEKHSSSFYCIQCQNYSERISS